jgi:hypothetical protein
VIDVGPLIEAILASPLNQPTPAAGTGIKLVNTIPGDIRATAAGFNPDTIDPLKIPTTLANNATGCTGVKTPANMYVVSDKFSNDVAMRSR